MVHTPILPDPTSEHAGRLVMILMPYYTGTVYPTPQQAQYRDEFVPLGRVGLLLGKDVAPEDARVAVLVERLKRHGAQPQIVAPAEDRSETLILVGDTGVHESLLGKLSVPVKPEGYLLHCAKNGTQHVVFLKGYGNRSRAGV